MAKINRLKYKLSLPPYIPDMALLFELKILLGGRGLPSNKNRIAGVEGYFKGMEESDF